MPFRVCGTLLVEAIGLKLGLGSWLSLGVDALTSSPIVLIIIVIISYFSACLHSNNDESEV